MNLNNFHYAMSLLETLYGINLPEDLFEEIALVGWNLIGNKIVKLYRYTIDNCDTTVELPCNADILEAVTTDFEDWNYVTNYSSNGDINSEIVENYIEDSKHFKDPLYASGKFLKYERVGNTLYFDKPYKKINILYKGILLDEDGLPLITDKEATALATYCAYISKFKEGILTNNKSLIEIANLLKQQWNILIDLARVDYYMSLNEWDLVLEARTDWDRKIHSKSFKIYR